MLIALTLQSELWTNKYTLNNEIISFYVFKGSHPISFSGIKFSMWEFMWLKCRDYPSLRASDQPMMKPRSLYGSRQEEMKAINRPTYSFWVNSGWTHMNKLHRNQAHLNSHHCQQLWCVCEWKNSLPYFLQDVCQLPKQILWKGNLKHLLSKSVQQRGQMVNHHVSPELFGRRLEPAGTSRTRSDLL